MSGVKYILEEMGYKLMDEKRFWRTKPLYRDSDNPTSLRISKQNGSFIDFSAGRQGSFEELIRLSLNLKNIREVKEWLGNKKFIKQEAEEESPRIELPIFWTVDVLDGFIPNHSFWIKKGVSEATISLFQGGVVQEGKLAKRYALPIFDNKKRIIGLTGRDLTNNSIIKWKLLGRKANWLWPLHLNREIIQVKKEIILVESPGCVLKLWEAGIKNTLCLFGVYLSDTILCFLAGISPNKIIIATNNEPDNNNIGNIAAEKIIKRLSRFINPNKIEIRLPTRKDFGQMSVQEICEWYK